LFLLGEMKDTVRRARIFTLFTSKCINVLPLRTYSANLLGVEPHISPPFAFLL